MRTFQTLALAMLAGTLITGCASTTVNQAAFKRTPKVAIVSVYGTANELFTDSKEDARLLADSAPVCITELRKSRHMRLVPAKAVLSARAYAAIKDDPSSFFAQLPGYKKFTPEDEQKHLKALARELHVDGFMLLQITFSRYTSGGIGIGPIGLGSEKPLATVSVSVFNPAMETMYFDNSGKSPEDGQFGFHMLGFTATDYGKMLSGLKGLTKSACQQVVQDLSDNLAVK